MATEAENAQLAILRQIRDRLGELEGIKAQLGDLRRLRELVAHRGRQEGAPDQFQPTMAGGLETPYAMADVSLTQGVDLVGKGPRFVGCGGSDDIHHFTGGQIEVSAQVQKPTGILSYAAEVQVVGMISNQQNVFATAVVTDTAPLLVPIPVHEAYTYITILARQLVNGLPSSASFADTPAMAGAKLTLAATGRFYR